MTARLHHNFFRSPSTSSRERNGQVAYEDDTYLLVAETMRGTIDVELDSVSAWEARKKLMLSKKKSWEMVVT